MTGGLAGVRIGVLRDLFRRGADFTEGNVTIERQIELLGANGAAMIDALTTGLDLVAMFPTLRRNSYELRAAFDAYLHRRASASPVKTLADTSFRRASISRAEPWNCAFKKR